MKNFMGLDRQVETAVQKHHHSLPKEPQEANPPEVSTIYLRDQNHCLPGDLVGKRPIEELCPHYGEHLQPLGGIWLLLPHHLLKPLEEVLHAHAQQSPRYFQAEPAYRP